MRLVSGKVAKYHRRAVGTAASKAAIFNVSHFLNADVLLAGEPPAPKLIPLQPMSDIDLMIANGWGEISQNRLPADWRERKNPKGKR